MPLLFLSMALAACSTVASGHESQNNYPPELAKLVDMMTLEEKAGQLSQRFVFEVNEDIEEAVRNGELGSVLFLTDPDKINNLQRIATEESRLGVPLIVASDVVHGYKTILPVPIAQAARFDLDAIRLGNNAAASEARPQGIHWAFAPMLDISRDARWGRIVESPGEDPYLASELARAKVEGFQGSSLADTESLLSGPKHFLGYGASDGGRDLESVSLSNTELYNVHLPPFESAIKAGALNIMSAYTELNDIPSSAKKNCLRTYWSSNSVLMVLSSPTQTA